MTKQQLPDCGELASIFSDIVREWVGDKIGRVVYLNATKEYRERGWCASHNYCDSNSAMLNALKQFGIVYDDPDESLTNLINKAWDMAKANRFGHPRKERRWTVTKDTDYAKEARGDARAMVQNFEDQIREQARGGEVSDDYANDFADGDSYHNESHQSGDYRLTEAAELLDQLRQHKETDRGMWEGCEPEEAIGIQASCTYANAVASQWSDLIGQLNTALGNAQPDEGCDQEDWNEAVAGCWIFLLDEGHKEEPTAEDRQRWAFVVDAAHGINCCQSEDDFTAMLIFLDWLDEKQKVRADTSEELRGLIRKACEKEFDEEESEVSDEVSP